MRIPALLLVCISLAACVASEPKFAASSQTYVKFSDSGAGGIGADTRYGEASLQAALPGAQVEGVQTAREDGTDWTLAAFIDGAQVLQFFKGAGGNVAEIHGVTQHLAGPGGERIGMSMREAGISRNDCRVGRNLWRGMAVCPARGSRNVTLVFAIPGYGGPFDALPSAGELEEAELQRIIWRAG